jgi:hypothetical protein
MSTHVHYGGSTASEDRVGQLFLSHSTDDDAIVRALQQALGDLGQGVWIDSRHLRGGQQLWPEIQKAIDDAEACAVVVSPSGLQSSRVGRELRHALDVQKRRGKDAYPVIPLSLDGTKLGVLEVISGEPPIYVPLRSAAGGGEAALDATLVALAIATRPMSRRRRSPRPSRWRS